MFVKRNSSRRKPLGHFPLSFSTLIGPSSSRAKRAIARSLSSVCTCFVFLSSIQSFLLSASVVVRPSLVRHTYRSYVVRKEDTRWRQFLLLFKSIRSDRETRLAMDEDIDDVKGVLSRMDEFHTLDLYKKASGSRLHRDPTTRKCQIFGLVKWSHW